MYNKYSDVLILVNEGQVSIHKVLMLFINQSYKEYRHTVEKRHEMLVN